MQRDEIFPGRLNPVSADEPTPVGGFYTQDDLREIVAYAAERYVDVIPEIEMPAHAAAAIASYPELACPVVDKFVGVFPGIGGPDAAIIMCAGNDSVFTFYQDVLDEVMDIFPSEYIHLGGDEADKSVWEKCPRCHQRLVDEGLNDYEELQGYFMDRMNRYVQSKGRKAIGWDEVTLGKPKEDITILGWQGMGNAAVNYARKTGRKFIMSPARVLYLLRYQGPQWFEPFTYFGNNTLSDVYNYEAVQPDWDEQLTGQLLGIQGSLWTEFCQSPEDVEYLLFPRLIAVADGAWRQPDTKDWPAFIEALDTFLPELENRGINYARSMFNIQHTAKPVDNTVVVKLECVRPDVDIRYTVDGTEPDASSTLYTEALPVKASSTVNAVTFKNGQPAGQTLKLDLDFNKATGHTVVSPNCNNDLAPVLTNGLRGTNRQSDFEWAGWFDADAEFTVDLGAVQPISSVKLGTLGFAHTCVAMPLDVEMFVSPDGNSFTPVASYATPEELVFHKEAKKHDIDFGKLDTEARFVKFVAKNPGHIPTGFAREGKPTWIYFDEIMIN